jgi:hypothetical protein
LPGALGTTYLLELSAVMIAFTFSNCFALASELPPNLTTFVIPKTSFTLVLILVNSTNNSIQNFAFLVNVHFDKYI